MIETQFPVYGKDMAEIEERAKMIARKFFGERRPYFRYEVEPARLDQDLWKATVHANWRQPPPPMPEAFENEW